MHEQDPCPFAAGDPDRRAIWEMLIARDTDAYLGQDWAIVADDFIAEGFYGVDARRQADPDQWRITFPTLASYRDEWLRQAAATACLVDASGARAAFLQSVTLTQIDISGDYAVAHKKFDGGLPNRDGSRQDLHWQTLYICRRHAGRWKIASFIGYMPLQPRSADAIHFPAATRQHRTAGPYTPVVAVPSSAQLLVISGQAPLDLEGNVIGATIAQQARATLDNCRTQLQAAGCELSHVFKATVYLTDLAHWHAFNEVYREYMTAPYPARTAVQTGLLPGMLVEVEMWAARP